VQFPGNADRLIGGFAVAVAPKLSQLHRNHYSILLEFELRNNKHNQVRADRSPATAAACAALKTFLGNIEKNRFLHGGHRYSGRHNNFPINFNLPSACSLAILCSSNLPHRRQ
jgi:hypothetical protein